MTKRRAIQVVVFLLLGAIVNVAVAWGCAAWSNLSWFTTQVVRTELKPGVYSTEGHMRAFGHSRIDRLVGGRTFDPQTGLAIEGSTHGALVPFPEFPEYIERSEDYAGFSMLSMVAYNIREIEINTPVSSQSFYFGDRGIRGGIPLSSVGVNPMWHSLPLRPIWPNFAINTIFYAAALWMVFALPFVLRRYFRGRRIKRGLCPACAYPVGASPVCTECGRPVKQSAIPPRRAGSGQKSAKAQT